MKTHEHTLKENNCCSECGEYIENVEQRDNLRKELRKLRAEQIISPTRPPEQPVSRQDWIQQNAIDVPQWDDTEKLAQFWGGNKGMLGRIKELEIYSQRLEVQRDELFTAAVDTLAYLHNATTDEFQRGSDEHVRNRLSAAIAKCEASKE